MDGSCDDMDGMKPDRIRKERLKECENGCDDIETAIPLIQTNDWVVHAKRAEHVRSQFRDLGVMLVVIICLAACVVFYFICPKCIFGILIFSACLCPFFHPMNAPLWLAIVLLIVSGWSFTAGNLSVTWSSGMH